MNISDLIIVKAKIRIRTLEEGGRRKTPIRSGYRPNHVFKQSPEPSAITAYVGDIQFDDFKLIYPGETKLVTVRFLSNPEIIPFLAVGSHWFIHEGPYVIADGEIIELC